MMKTIEEINEEKKGLEQKKKELETRTKELEQKIKDIESKKNTINNELSHAVHFMKKKNILKN